MLATLSRTTVGVMGSGTSEHDEYARPVGEALADMGVNLLTGGKPVVVSSPVHELVERFPRQPTRVDSIEGLRQFLRPHVVL
jgi:SLOG-like protein